MWGILGSLPKMVPTNGICNKHVSQFGLKSIPGLSSLKRFPDHEQVLPEFSKNSWMPCHTCGAKETSGLRSLCASKAAGTWLSGVSPEELQKGSSVCPDLLPGYESHVSLPLFNWNYLKMLLWIKSCVFATICVNLRSCHVNFLLATFQLHPRGSPSRKGELKGGKVHLCSLGGTVLRLPLKR